VSEVEPKPGACSGLTLSGLTLPRPARPGCRDWRAGEGRGLKAAEVSKKGTARKGTNHAKTQNESICRKAVSFYQKRKAQKKKRDARAHVDQTFPQAQTTPATGRLRVKDRLKTNQEVVALWLESSIPYPRTDGKNDY